MTARDDFEENFEIMRLATAAELEQRGLLGAADAAMCAYARKKAKRKFPDHNDAAAWLEEHEPRQLDAVKVLLGIIRDVSDMGAAARQALDALVQDAVPLAGSQLLPVEEFWSSTHRATNSSARYAEVGAIVLAERIREECGIDTQVVRLEELPGTALLTRMPAMSTFQEPRGYRVEARVMGEVDAAILKRKAYNLRAMVAGYWKRQCQPRVIFSGLPYDYEASVGLDYQGRDVGR